MTQSQTTGFIGTGVMGEPMCRNLAAKSGQRVLAWDPAPAPLERLRAEGVQVAGSAAEVAAEAGVLFLCLPGGAQLKALCDGTLLAAARKGQTVVDLGTSGGEIDFLQSLAFLDDSYIAVWGLLTSARVRSDTDVLLLGPSGIWIFEVKYWNGTIFKGKEGWYSVSPAGRRRDYPKGPDEQWLQQVQEITKTIRMRLGNRAWPADLIKGGVVFAHRNTSFGQVANPLAACGRPGAWHKRIRDAKPLEGFSLSDQFQVLDALTRYANLHEREEFTITSAKETAEDLYVQAAAGL